MNLAAEVEKLLKGVDIPLKVAVMGCVVNGPGEVRDADIGVVGGKGKGLIIRRGEIVHTVPEADLLLTFKKELDKVCAEYRRGSDNGLNRGERRRVSPVNRSSLKKPATPKPTALDQDEAE